MYIVNLIVYLFVSLPLISFYLAVRFILRRSSFFVFCLPSVKDDRRRPVVQKGILRKDLSDCRAAQRCSLQDSQLAKGDGKAECHQQKVDWD